jgi:hypothetical protein
VGVCVCACVHLFACTKGKGDGAEHPNLDKEKMVEPYFVARFLLQRAQQGFFFRPALCWSLFFLLTLKKNNNEGGCKQGMAPKRERTNNATACRVEKEFSRAKGLVGLCDHLHIRAAILPIVQIDRQP